MKLLIVGGYGAFGARLAALFATTDGLELLIAGRSLDKATAFCATYQGKPRTRPIELDRTDIARHLPDLKPDIVIDASGPFQAYGDGGFHVVEACIAQGVNYLDLSDSRSFVTGISAFDDAAKRAGVFALSGVSSCPALSSAAVRALSEVMDIKTIEAGIAPTPRAALGPNVLGAVLSYAGAPVEHIGSGRKVTSLGLVSSRRFTIAPPGTVPLRSTRFALVDVPEFDVWPDTNPHLKSVWFGAGTRPQVFLHILSAVSWLRAKLRLPGLARFAGLFHRVQSRANWGEHRGGMYVHATGMADGRPAQASWHLLAEGDDGPFVPAMAIHAVVEKCLAGARPAPGARPASDELEISDFQRSFGDRKITMGLRQAPDPDGGLYPQILGSAFARLPPRVQELHRVEATHEWSGEARIDRGNHPLARLIAAIIGFPKAAETSPVTVTLERQGRREKWTRNFGGQRFHSIQFAGHGRHDTLLLERFGQITVALAVTVRDGRLDLIPRHWSVFGVPMPRWALPRGACFEVQDDQGRFRFDVTIGAPLIGMIVRYRGWLRPKL